MTKITIPDSNDLKYWQIAPGESGRLWNDLRNNSIIAVGYSEFDFDLTGITNEELTNIGKEKYSHRSARSAEIRLTMLRDFLSLKLGDKIISNKGISSLLALGTVISGYKYRPERSEYKHTIDVDYFRISPEGIPIPGKFKHKYFGKTIVPVNKADFEEMGKLFYEIEDLKYWIFQGNPEDYDISSALTELQNMTWNVKKHETEISKGDTAFIWEAGKNAGVLAVAEILDSPKMMQEYEEEKKFHKSDKHNAFIDLRVPIRIKILLDKRIHRTDLKTHPVLKDMQILKFAQGTNFPLTGTQGKALMAEIESIHTFKEPSLNFYVPDKDDFEKAYRMIAKPGEDVSMDSVLNQIEISMKQKGQYLNKDWRMVTERNVKIWSTIK